MESEKKIQNVERVPQFKYVGGENSPLLSPTEVSSRARTGGWVGAFRISIQFGARCIAKRRIMPMCSTGGAPIQWAAFIKENNPGIFVGKILIKRQCEFKKNSKEMSGSCLDP
ncbi:hypothetical protein CDAR_382391 [Caerostris darwini]|uniref:Uncharacterized protein n=1 Tax=Caerostris darwini TaxID=1538125 RepID=A0AAV4VYW5_9ARAC|nr:hypothetical protein CDAR_382391 [Caerostris darwini]